MDATLQQRESDYLSEEGLMYDYCDDLSKTRLYGLYIPPLELS